LNKLLSLDDYIEEYCGGKKGVFAVVSGKYPQNVAKYNRLNYQVVVTDKRHILVQKAKNKQLELDGEIYHVRGEWVE